MKRKALISIVFILSVIFIYAQSPQAFKYQAVLRDAQGYVRQNESVVIKISIRQGSGSGTEVFSETHNTQTNEFGLVNLNVGTINPSGFASIDWSDGPYFVKIFVDGTVMGTSQLLSIPYALHSINAEEIAGNPVGGTPSTDEVLKWDGTQWIPQDDGLTLHYHADYYGSTYAFLINSYGTGTAASFQQNNAEPSLYVTQDGTGKAGRFTSDNSNANYAVSIDSWSNTHEAFYACNDGSGGAAYFDGDVEVNGNFSSSNKYFKIDHPLEPEQKYLYHSCVESSDMMNVYNGNIVLDINGEGLATLPDWFESLNSDFRYQLTCIGGFAQIYISQEINDNKFKIAGGKLGLKVSWQVTGIRKDPWAQQHRMKVEVEKTEQEKGHYLHYKEYNQPIEKSIKVIKNPDLLENQKIIN
jgi:hypothetical protein